ncbi:MAG: hypothetical protein AABY26_05955 [Nanoarchaeota archaeon]
MEEKESQKGYLGKLALSGVAGLAGVLSAGEVYASGIGYRLAEESIKMAPRGIEVIEEALEKATRVLEECLRATEGIGYGSLEVTTKALMKACGVEY